MRFKPSDKVICGHLRGEVNTTWGSYVLVRFHANGFAEWVREGKLDYLPALELLAEAAE